MAAPKEACPVEENPDPLPAAVVAEGADLWSPDQTAMVVAGPGKHMDPTAMVAAGPWQCETVPSEGLSVGKGVVVVANVAVSP